MQIDGIRWYRNVTQALLASLLLIFSVTGAAQQPERASLPLPPGEPIPEDYYRAEFVILERIIEPEAVNEKMSEQTVAPPTETEEVLWSVLEDGTTETTLELAPEGELHLANAARRLERSGKYRVLVSAGWYEAFPPDYKGTPLRVSAGDWIPGAGIREVEGHITIDRQRYLHVRVHLNHWQLADDPQPALEESEAVAIPATGTEPKPEPGSASQATASADNSAVQADTLGVEPVPLELLTWIRETRRMRSEEVHFLDSPTIGVLIFFKKIEAAE